LSLGLVLKLSFRLIPFSFFRANLNINLLGRDENSIVIGDRCGSAQQFLIRFFEGGKDACGILRAQERTLIDA